MTAMVIKVGHCWKRDLLTTTLESLVSFWRSLSLDEPSKKVNFVGSQLNTALFDLLD